METLNTVKQLISEFNAAGLTEMDLEIPGLKLSLSKENASAPSLSSKVIEQGAKPEPETEAPQNPETANFSATTITAPLVGIYYAAPAPGESAFIEEGQIVKKGDVLCIIEAMKAMNELNAPYDLKVRRILVENGDMVEFKQPLFEVEKC